MSDRQSLRAFFAALGLILGALFTVGVIRSILTGDTEWWSAFLLLPVFLIMYRLYDGWLRDSGRSR